MVRSAAVKKSGESLLYVRGEFESERIRIGRVSPRGGLPDEKHGRRFFPLVQYIKRTKAHALTSKSSFQSVV